MAGSGSGSGGGNDPRRQGSEQGGATGGGDLTPEERAAFERRASELGQRLESIKARKAPQRPDGGARGKAMGDAFRIVADLVVGIAAGGGIGWFLDQQLGTRPWLLVLFLVIGLAAGISNVVRTARKMQAEAEPLQRRAKSVKDDDEDDR